MENQEIAKKFSQIANILELKNDNPFRIRAYRKVSQAIKDLSENIKVVADKGKLQDIPGIGQATAKKIKQIIETGTCKYYQTLMNTPEAQLIEMLDIPGLGPKLIKQAHEKLNINNLNDLEKLAQKGKLRDLERMGEKSEQKILKAIQYFKQSKTRFKLSEALPYAEIIINKLKKCKKIKNIGYAGSLRRMKKMVGDIDILVTAEKKSKVMDKFTSLSEVKDIISKGETKASVLLTNGIQVDLRLVSPENFGAALVYFTGSKQHNIAIRKIGKKLGLKINEYGVFNIKNNQKKRIAGKTEQEVYKCIDLSFIPPELRENKGEIQAARQKNLPELINLSDYKGDLQMHTNYSDGAYSIEEMAEAAKTKGYEYIAITDHSKAVRIAGGLKPEEVVKQIKKINKINEKINGITILSGIEVDILDTGKLDLPDAILEKCDLVIAAVHSKFGMNKNEMTQRIINAIKNENVNILAHPTGRILQKRPPYKINIEKIIKSAKKYNIALELNSHPERLDIDAGYCRICKENNTKVSINTDAHNIMQLNLIKYGIYTARRGWLEPNDVINTFSLKKLKKFLKK